MGACIQLTAVWNSDSIQKMLYFAALLAVPPLNIVLAATALTRISKSRGRLLGVIASTVALVTSLLALLAIIAVMILGFYMMRNFNPG